MIAQPRRSRSVPPGCWYRFLVALLGGAVEQFHQGKLQDHEYPTALVEEAMAHLPQVTVS